MEYECTEENIQKYFNYKMINDPIYGCIGLSELEVALLDTKAMQRLRHIKQMGFSEYIFPGGEHTRFTHSLGVLYIMGRMCEVLYRNGDIEPEDVRKMRVAALLHDVGHYPYSHLGEIVYSFIDQEEAALIQSDELSLNLLCRIANHKKRKLVDHEHLGATVIENDPQISELLYQAEIDPHEIGGIITGKIPVQEDQKDIEDNRALYVQMMHSSLDADRFDYLMRDSTQAGVSFGKIEMDYIINSLKKVKYTYRQGGTGKTYSVPSLAVSTKAQSAVEHFLMGRYFHYSRTVSHKSAIAFEAAAKLLMYRTINAGYLPAYVKNYKSVVDTIGTEKFYLFTDEQVWNSMNRYANESCEPIVKMLWETVGYRKKPASIKEIKNIIPKDDSVTEKKSSQDLKYEKTGEVIQQHWKAIAETVGIDSERIGYVEHSVNLEVLPKVVNPKKYGDYSEEVLRDAVKLVNKEGKVSLLFSDETSLINKMVGYLSKSTYIFAIGISDTDIIQKMKEELKKRIKSAVDEEME